jgi:hypothetical protein
MLKHLRMAKAIPVRVHCRGSHSHHTSTSGGRTVSRASAAVTAGRGRRKPGLHNTVRPGFSPVVITSHFSLLSEIWKLFAVKVKARPVLGVLL